MKTIKSTIFQSSRVRIALCTSLALISFCASAQIFSVSEKYYKGFNVSFGRYDFRSKSNFTEIDRNKVSLSGGELGLLLGTRKWRAVTCVFGYYSSISDIAGTIDLYKHSLSGNVYPLAFLTNKKNTVDPYVSAGINYNRFKLYGEYIENDSGFPGNPHVIERYLGNMKHVNATVGAGLELKVLDDYDFVHIFAETIYASNLTNTFEPPDYRNTTISNQWMFSLGLRYGGAPRN